MQLVKALPEHIPDLVRISKAAFDSDVTVGSSAVGVPPEYDSPEWHIEMMNQGHLFAAIDGRTVIGGAILFGDENDDSFMYIGRIFISPDVFRRGYGIELMRQIESFHPRITAWYLDTPIWNIRTNNFYKKVGYAEIKRDDEMIYYRKIISR